MNPSTICTRSIAALMACSLFTVAQQQASAQTTAFTDPVGYITLNILGTGGAGGSKLSLRGLGLTRPVEYQGSAETVSSNSLTDNEGTFTNDQFNGANGAHYIEIVRPAGQATPAPGEGTTYDILDTVGATKTITTVQASAAGVVNGANFKIRKHWTIGTVFGPNNEAGLGGGDNTTADQILRFNAQTAQYETFYYLEDPFDPSANAWVDAIGAVATNVAIYPDDGLFIKRLQSPNLPVVLMGAVKTGSTSFPISAGFNVLSNPYAAPVTLGSSGLYTGNPATGVQGGDNTTADLVLLFDGTNYLTYYYLEDPFDPGANAWVDSTGTVATNVQIPVGSAFVIKRGGATGFNWQAPQHPASL